MPKYRPPHFPMPMSYSMLTMPAGHIYTYRPSIEIFLIRISHIARFTSIHPKKEASNEKKNFFSFAYCIVGSAVCG